MPAVLKPLARPADVLDLCVPPLSRLAKPAVQRCAAALRRTALSMLVVLVAGCSSTRPWLNEPLPLARQAVSERQAELQTRAARDPSMLVAVTLSGGGARAAAFGFGVLTAMQQAEFHWRGKDRTLLDATDLVSGVSGGALWLRTLPPTALRGCPGLKKIFCGRTFKTALSPKRCGQATCMI